MMLEFFKELESGSGPGISQARSLGRRKPSGNRNPYCDTNDVPTPRPLHDGRRSIIASAWSRSHSGWLSAWPFRLGVWTDEDRRRTTVPGLYGAGDMASRSRTNYYMLGAFCLTGRICGESAGGLRQGRKRARC